MTRQDALAAEPATLPEPAGGPVAEPAPRSRRLPPRPGRDTRRTKPRVALVHDYLLVRRGAERTFEAIAECWPEAPIFTLLYDEAGTEGSFAHREIHTSYLQRVGSGQAGFRRLLPAFPRAARSLRLDGYDLIISSSSAFAHLVRVPRG